MSSHSLTPRERYERRIFFLLRLGDFASRAPRPAGPDPHPTRLHGAPVPSLNPDVVSIFGDQTLRALGPRIVPLSEDGWDYNYPRRVRTYGGPHPALRQSATVARSNFPMAPPPVERDEELWDWLFSMGRFRGGWSDFALDPPRHRFYYTPAPAGRMPIVFPTDWSIAEVAHQYFVTQVLSSWYQYQIVGSSDMPILVAWNARAQSWKFQARNFNRNLSDELCEEYGDVFKALALAEGSLSPVHATAAIEQFLLFEQFLLWLPRVGAQVAVSQRFFDLVDELLELEDPASIPDDREFELDLVSYKQTLQHYALWWPLEALAKSVFFLQSRSAMPIFDAAAADQAPFAFCNSFGERYIVPDLASLRSSVTVLPLGWHDPRQPQSDGDTEYCAWFTFTDMQYWYDYVAEAGFNGLHARFTPAVSALDGEPLDAEGESAHFLVGSDLQDFLLDQFLPASEFHGAPVVPVNSRVPSRAPTPVPSTPTMSSPSPSPRWVEQDFSPAFHRSHSIEETAARNRGDGGGRFASSPSSSRPVPSTSLLFAPAAGEEQKVFVTSPSPSISLARTEAEVSFPSSSLEVAFPSSSSALVLSSSPSMFAREAHRPIGAVVRQLVPGCERCGSDRFCSDDTDPCAPKSKKPRSSCYTCAKGHGSCPEWKSFHEAFNERDDEELAGFSFEFWEHLGGGRYQLLFPDPRVADLRALEHRTVFAPYARLEFLGRTLVRASTRSALRAPPAGPPRVSSPSSSFRFAPAAQGELFFYSSFGFNWGDYDLDAEPAPPPSQQASSSRAPPPRSSRPAAEGSSSSSTRAPQPPAADVPMEEDPSPLSAFFAEVEEFTPENATRDAARISAFLADQPIELHAQFLSHIASVMNIVEDELGVEMPAMDRKGKGKACE
ncbi:hypothetical protein C8R46DRAFT_1039000 [Mycena filopes]|nr:hypothetical protein C8R46DRAFT_1039000 [Mycena filopes]